MTDREREIFRLIESNPLISQAEIASKLEITRTSVGVHISNLIKKGYIMGKGYIMAYSHPVTVIGGANVDIQGNPMGKLLMEDSNPGQIKTSLGGVGRNIADNMSRLEMDIRLITAIGNDSEGTLIRDNARDLGIDIENSLSTSIHRTSTYMYVLDERGEMVVAVSDMTIVNMITPEYLKVYLARIDHSPYTVLDANLPKRTLVYLANNLKSTKLVLDPVSVAKAVKAKDILGKLYAVKLNRMETEALLDITLADRESIVFAGKILMDLGIEKVFITLGQEGVYFVDKDGGFFRDAIHMEVVNATGAGDAFTAAMVYGFVHDLDKDALVDFCIGASSVTLSSENTIADGISVETIESLINKNH